MLRVFWGVFWYLFVTAPVFADAHIWHIYGHCLIAETKPRVHLSDAQGPQKLRLGGCTKEVSNTKARFRTRLIWFAGDDVLIRAQARGGSLEVFIDQDVALPSTSDILGFQDCYSVVRVRGFLHICFKGPGPVIDGPAVELDGSKGRQHGAFRPS